MAGVKRTFASMANVNGSQPVTQHASLNPLKIHRLETSPAREHTRGTATISRSTSSTPPQRSLRSNAFESDASIVLVGIRGSGKSTLAIIASTAMKRRIIDTEKSFQEATGLSTVAYKKTHGNLEYQRRQHGILDATLTNHRRDCIIVTSWMERGIHALLESFAVSHPVVHVTRDQRAIQEYLRVADEEKMRELLKYTATTFRSVANFEFFNVSEELPKLDSHTSMVQTARDVPGDPKYPAPYLNLKRAERHFLKFLSLVMPKGTIPFIESAFPLASIPTESRQFTYATSIPLSRLLLDEWDIRDLETGADAVEIVVDDAYDATTNSSRQCVPMSSERASLISKAVGNVRRSVVIPIIYHVPWPVLGATNKDQESTYLDHVQHGLRLGLEYLTIDLRLDYDRFSDIMDSRRASKIIGTVHMGSSLPPPSWTDPVWVSYYRKAQSLSCNLVRLTRPASLMEDNFEINTIRGAVRESGHPRLPLVAFNTGYKGRNSACFNQILTSVLPESLIGTFPEEDSTSSYVAPSVSAPQATSVLQSSFITDALKLYVLGADVSQSISPAMHNTAMSALGLSHFYKPYSTESLSNVRELIQDPRFAGASISLPFKVKIISLTHSLSSHAKAIGAVNTLIPLRHLNADGSIPDDALLVNSRNRAGPVLALYGENTDWVGIRACIRRGLSPANAVRPSTAGLVIGAGGMGRAAVYSMLQLGVKNIAIYNRTPAHAEKLVAHFTRLLARHDLPLLSPSDDAVTRFVVLRSRDEPWPEHIRLPTMVVSCIPTYSIGTNPSPNFTLPSDWMKSPTGGVVVEFSYKKLNTPLIIQTRAEAHRGWVAMDGLDLLPEQGFAQFELFTGKRAPRRLMRGEVFRSYRDEGQLYRTQLQPRLENIIQQEP